VEQLERHLGLIRQYWGDEAGEAERPGVAAQSPRRSHPIPLVLGGTGRRMMELVRRYADWWNLPANHLDKLPKLAPAAGRARLSVQQMVGFVRSGSDPNTVREVSARRFGNLGSGLVCGDAGELIQHFTGLTAQRVERFYVWFSDFAAPDSLHEFGESVIKAFPTS
jgi:alkanesulfonate monooxygenase SsuD/methylene tetrahydromethanopterin reductase-like flavin-dependent oxidoreductase (luciferase family)